MLISLLLGALLIIAAEAHVREVEHLRDDGVFVDGTITGLGTQVLGGRTPAYWVEGEYHAASASGLPLTLAFRFDISADEYSTLAKGDTLALVYDPDNRTESQRVSNLAQEDTAGLRAVALLTAAVYLLIGTAISALDWRMRLRVSVQSAKLRSAFGAK